MAEPLDPNTPVVLTHHSGRFVSFPVQEDPPVALRAGWTVPHPAVARIDRVVNLMYQHVEDAWQRDDIPAAIRRAQRLLRLKAQAATLHAAHPPLTVHGPIQHPLTSRQFNRAMKHQLAAMADTYTRRASEEMARYFGVQP